MKSRSRIPLYAERNAITLTDRQWRQLRRSRRLLDNQATVRVAQTRDGQWWAEWRGDMLWWASRWHAIPHAIGKRAQTLDEFVESL